MSNRYPDTSEVKQRLAVDISRQITSRLALAEPDRMLSDGNGQTVMVMREPDGSRFVSREFGSGSWLVGEDHLTGTASFTERWEQFEALFVGAPFSLVPSSIVRDDAEGAQVISVYRENVRPLREATYETKEKILEYLVAITIGGVGSGRLAPAVIQPDMFNVIEPQSPDNPESVELLDVDPYLSATLHDVNVVNRILQKLIDLIANMDENGWSVSEEERMALAGVIIREIIKHRSVESLLDDLYHPFWTAHSLSNGVYER